ncbi:MAG: UPF0182 family protein [Bacillota bacterium]
MRNRFWIIIIAAVIAVSVLFTITSFYLDLLWFIELDTEQIFWTQFRTQWGLRIAGFLFLFAFLFCNLMLTKNYILSFPNLALRERLMATGAMRFITPRRLTIYFLVASAVIAYIFSGYVPNFWMDVLRYFNQTSFGISDPIFGADVSFYVFGLPFYRFLYSYLIMVVVLTLIIVAAIYLLLNPPSQGKQGWMLPPTKGVSHLAVLLALVFGLKAWDYRLSQLELLLSDLGVVYGAGYTDINANYFVLMVLMFLAAAIALLFLANIFIRRFRLFLYGILVLVGVSLLGGWAYPAAIQSFVVEPSEFDYEEEYLAHGIEFTRAAYGLDQFKPRPFAANQQLSWNDLRENDGTIKNVRLWDYRPLLTTFNELQAIRPYYRFLDVDIDRYTADGEYRQVMISAREMDKSRLAEQAQTWINLRLQFTHGYGVAVTPVNEVTPEGMPQYFLGDIPPRGDLDLENPSIYFGELTDDYVFINTGTPEFHYATAGDENEFTFYDGDAGIPIQSVLRRALMALRFGEYRILISNELSNESRLIFDRNIHDRVRKIAPFLSYDSDPYIVVSDNQLYWIQDAYTTTDRYPYSQPYNGANYIRNSVKVVIDAYNGDVDYYIADPEDPLIQTYSKIFPDLFKPMEDMPENLMDNIRYPLDMFTIQTRMMELYHITDPNQFYSREDLWSIPTEVAFGQEQLMEPYYTILELPGYDKPEYVLILPFTPDNRNNMIAWMVARCDRPNYGDVEIFNFPRERVILGPKQIENRIDQSTEISEQFTLWGQVGSRVIRGNLLVLPINDALLYVEPIFLEADTGGLPELARVIVAFDETVVMAETLDQALIKVFGEIGELPADIPSDDLPDDIDLDDPIPDLEIDLEAELTDLIIQAQAVYEEALELQQEGDWAGYGDKIKELEEILSDLANFTQ